MENKRKWLLYCSYTKDGEEKLVDYTLIAVSRVAAKRRAMNRMIIAGGENRGIDGCHELTKKFLKKEKSFARHEGKAL
jgi:hypothetical protein